MRALPLFVTVPPPLAPAATAALERAGATSVVSRGGGVVSFVARRGVAESALSLVGATGVVSLDCRGRRHEVPNDPGYVSQWALPAVRAPAAWDRTHGSTAVVVAVVDSGVDGTHPDLAGKLVPGYDAVHGTPLAPGNTDQVGHGTAVAGVIAATPNNGGGVAGLGWDTRVVAVKDGDALPLRSATVAGIRWAADHGFRLINVSSGYPAPDENETDAVAYARSKGAVVFASAGDAAQSGNPVNYPAAVEGAVGVGAVGFDGSRAPYSNTGSYVDLVAPGGSADGQTAHDIHVLAPGGGTTFRAGTSFSAPHAAAAAALVMAASPLLSASDAVGLLTSTAADLGAPGRDSEYGAGLLDADAAVAATSTTARSLRPASGYRLVARDGGIFAVGDAPFLGSTGALRLAAPIVGSATTPSGKGYWLVASDGGIFAFGDARFLGSTGAVHLARPVVGMAPTPSGNGYWLVASDGGVFAFGDARFLGSTGALPLARPIVGMAPSPSGDGYTLVASDGGVFGFGTSAFFGSTGAVTLRRPMVGMAATPSGRGYWLVASDGGIFAFGDARFLGSAGGLALARPIVGMAATPSGGGYWLVAADGGVFAFGDARFHGSAGGLRLNQPITGMTVAR
ncbi:MAG TPA: S8 family serine peptidase [Acidimicrobiales bacterium]|nr:S8 family serine peptidase [Acidimicrobiales bacterium]